MPSSFAITVSDDEENAGRMRVYLRLKSKRTWPLNALLVALRLAMRWWPVLLLFLPVIALLVLESSWLGSKPRDASPQREAEEGGGSSHHPAGENEETPKNLNRLDPITRVVHGVRELKKEDSEYLRTIGVTCKVVVSTCAFGGGDDLCQPVGMTESSLKKGSILAISEHGARSSLYDEGKAVVKKNKATQEEVELQLNQYRLDGIPDDKRLNEKKALAEASVIVREHTPTSPFVSGSKKWSDFTSRDQLSFPFVPRRFLYVPDKIF